jgi:hypothetical protein
MAWLNSFNQSRSVTAFEQLSDGRVLMEVGRALFRIRDEADTLAGNELHASTATDPRPGPARVLTA